MIISRNTKIFLVVFSLILVALTAGAIVYTNTHKGTDESQIIIEDAMQMNISSLDSTAVMNDTTKGISMRDTYYSNGLTYTYNSSERNGVPLTYPVIDGLNNGDVQRNINEQIVQKINKVLDSNNFKNNSDNSAYASATVVGNFSDVLSVKIYVKFNESFGKYYGVNFRVDNGERIKASDLFTYNAPKRNIITENAYKSFTIGYYTAEGLSNDFYTNIDFDILNFLSDYNNGRVAEFSFTPMFIELYREGKTVRIDMKEYAEYIAIYNRYKSSSNLYSDSDKIVDGLPVFTERQTAVLFDLYEKVNDSCILDIYILKSDSERNDFTEREMEVINNFKYDFIAKLKDVKKEKGIYYSNYVTVSRGKEDDEDVLIFTENEAFIKTLEEDFEKYYNKILEAERDLSDEDYISSKIDVLNENDLSKGVFETKYSLETGREYVKEPEDEEPEEPEEPNSSVSPEESNESQGSNHSERPTPSPTDSENNSPEPTNSFEPEPSPSPTPTDNITTQVYF